MKLNIKLPSFSITRGEIPGDVEAEGRARNLRRRLKSFGLWGLVGFAFFVLFSWLSLPTEAIAWRIGHEAKKQGYLIDVEDVSIRPWGTVILENVTWTFEPSREDMPPGKYFFEEIDVDIGLLSLLAGNIDVEVEHEREEGRLWASYEADGESSRFELEIEDLPLYEVPKAAQTLGVPLLGIFAMKAELELPENKFAKATGFIELSCSGCRAGDGEAKLYMPGKHALKGGMTIPEIDLGTLTGKLTVEKGEAVIDGAVETSSDDLWVELTGKIKLRDPFPRSRFEMVFKVRLTDALQERSEALRISYQTANPKTKLEPPEQGLGFRVEGPVTKPRFVGVGVKSSKQLREERRARARARDERRRAKSEARKRAKAKIDSAKVDDADAGGDDDKGGDDQDDTAKAPPTLNVQPIDPPSEEPPAEEPQQALPPAEGDGGEAFDPAGAGGQEPDVGQQQDGQQQDGQQQDGQQQQPPDGQDPAAPDSDGQQGQGQ